MITIMPKDTFVEVIGTRGRIGKVVRRFEEQVEVEFYHSLIDRPCEWFPISGVRQISISKQTRCYFRDEETGRWKMGRIRQQVGNEYEVDFPDRESCYLDGSKLFVRSDRPIDDPMELLEERGQETAFFAERRTKFMDTLLRQRQASQGMHGLVSSNIHLYKHQVEVIRRVLEDPVPRYLLADEVGLGKTIEAGAIMRQYLLDHPQAEALLLVPPHLMDQWQREMHDKFYFAQFGERVTWLSTDEIKRVKEWSDKQWGMVMIDEAHELAAKAYSTEGDEQEQYQLLQRVSRRTKGMLLLSATPVLNNERGFLAMLHLLDPDSYHLEDLEHFRQRVEKRQEIGHLLLNFKEDAKPFVLKRTLNQLTELFPEDFLLQPMIRDLREAMEDQAVLERRKDCIRNIRIHLSDTYRLHRRMLRNRRDVVAIDLPYSRSESAERTRMNVVKEYDLDDRTERLEALLDEWRMLAFESEYQVNLQELFLLMLETSGSSPQLWLDVLQARLSGQITSRLQKDLSPHQLRVLIDTERFAGEEEYLRRMVDLFSEPAEMGDRIDQVVQLLRQFRFRANKSNTPVPKVVVFTSYPSVCKEILNRLRAEYGQEAVAGFYNEMDKRTVEVQVDTFQQNVNCFALVCDRTGEEGLNLQLADVLVHFDLPLSPTRVEQRTGRLDRLGRNKPFTTYVFTGTEETEGSLHHVWFEYLKDGLHVFESSIATLQFFIEDQIPHLMELYYSKGIAGVRGVIETAGPHLADELQRIYEQQALDELDMREQHTDSLFSQLVAYEANPAQIQAGFEGWIVDALKVRPQRLDKENRTFYYNPLHALIPTQHSLKFIEGHNRPHTYNRQVAVRTSDCTLYRIGEPFLDFLAWYLRWDDRGQVYCFWRQEPTLPQEEGLEQFYFKLHYVVEGDLGPAEEVLQQFGQIDLDRPALQRKLDHYFPAHFQTMLVDTDGQAIEDQVLRDALSKPFCKREHGGRDINLTKERLEVLDRYFTDETWRASCRDARIKSEGQLRRSEAFQDLCLQRADTALREWGIHDTQLELRAQREGVIDAERAAASLKGLQFERALHDALVKGIREPKIRLDSVGMIVLSGLQLPKP